MVKKVFVKNTLRIFTSNFSRFISVLLIVFVGIAFVTGLGTLAEMMTDSIQQYFKDNNGADIILKTSSPFGFTDSRIDEIKNNEYVEDIKTHPGYQYLQTEDLSFFLQYLESMLKETTSSQQLSIIYEK